jgi:hypothetical protein
MPIEVVITRLPLIGITGCVVPVIPGTTDCDGPMSDRTELCAIDANWLVGLLPTCDHHAKHIADLMEWGWESIVAEAGRDLDSANRPVDERQRHSQEHTRAGLETMTK